MLLQQKWFNANRNWTCQSIYMREPQCSIKDVKFNSRFGVLMILKYNSNIELKSLRDNLSISINIGDVPIDFVLWGHQGLELYVFTSSGMVFVIQISSDFNSWKVARVMKTNYSSFFDSFYVGNEFISPEVCSLFSLNSGNILKRIYETYLNTKISSVCLFHDLIIFGTKMGEIIVMESDHIQRFENIHTKDITVTKIINENMFVTCGKDSKVFLWKRKTDKGWRKIFLGQHSGWIYDCIVDNDSGTIYTSGGDGIVCIWDLNKTKMVDFIPIYEGVASSLALDKDQKIIYVGHHLGKLFQIKWKGKSRNQYHKNSIWNMFVKKGLLYTGGADSQVLCFRISDGKLMNTIKTSRGWINGFDHSKALDCIVAVTSQGDILYLKNSSYEITNIKDHWLNNVKVNDRTKEIYVASAEGDIVVLDAVTKKIKRSLTGHRDQVLDILLDYKSNLIISASVDGTLIFWNESNHQQVKHLSVFNFHPTSMTISNNMLLVGSLEGDIIFIDLNNFNISNRINQVHNGRLWKISSYQESKLVATIGTDHYLHLWEMDGFKKLASWKSDRLLTTCLLINGQLFVGNEDGEVSLFQLKEKNDINKLKIIPQHKNILYIDKKHLNTVATTERVIEILQDLDMDFIIHDVTHNKGLREWIISQSGWDRFPQVFFNGKFIGAGKVLFEMYRTKTLERIVKKCHKQKRNFSLKKPGENRAKVE